MKAISLTQPWATLAAIGAKRIETRSWRTAYHGPLAIHAARSFPKPMRLLCHDRPFSTALAPHGYYAHNLPLDAIVATATLVECYRIPSERKLFRRPDLEYFNIGVWLPPDPPELDFGDYTPGRYAWLLANIQPLPEPAPARGALGLWEWTGTAGVIEQRART